MEGDILRDQIRQRVKSEQVKCTDYKGKDTNPCPVAQDGDLGMTKDKRCKGCGLHIPSLNLKRNTNAYSTSTTQTPLD